ncbi:TIGR02186 family protein [Pelagibacterium limicola]|uniref:TIGR02186 family protein n=1 Tax=Pelagibacterium limicola TaxID=2791022 RepID=UPI001FE6640D|nr:TIGR02186 family protein [Pelagibacterium limicola]
MSLLRLIGALVVIVVASAAPARAQGVILGNSDPNVTIHSNFTGRDITLFGSIEPGAGSVPVVGPFDVVIVVRGPSNDRVVRVKDRVFGIVLNAGHAVYRALPGYYAVHSSGPLEQIMGPGAMGDPRVSLPTISASARVSADSERFDAELVRLMEGAGLFHSGQRRLSFLSPTTFVTRIRLPSSAPNGAYLAIAMVLVDGNVVGTSSTTFSVWTEGFERFLSRMSRERPFLFGIVSVLIALATGWLGGVLFRR